MLHPWQSIRGACSPHAMCSTCFRYTLLNLKSIKKMYMLEIDSTRHKTCFVLLNAPSPWASPGPPMPRLFLLSTPLFMTFHILYIHGFPPIPSSFCPSQLHPPSPVILSPVSLSPGWAWSLDSWKHEGEESPLLFTVWSPVVPDLFPGQEPPQLSGCGMTDWNDWLASITQEVRPNSH